VFKVLLGLKKNVSKIFFSDSESRTIFNSSFSLLAIQGTNLLLPLILIPYLVKVLGLEKFGLVSFAQSFISFWIIFADYGFQISATREVALFKNNREKLSEIVNNTLKTKLALCVVAFLVYCVIIYSIPAFSKYLYFYLLTFIMVVGQSFVPTWFFQGMEKMHFLTYINFISKLLFTGLIFLLIKKSTDFSYVTLLYGLGNLVAGIIGILFMYKKFLLSFQPLKRFSLFRELKKGWYVFVSNFAVNTYLNANTLFLGFFGNEVIVGFYSVAEKVVYALKLLVGVFFQATFPRVCQLKEKGQEYLFAFFKRYFIPFLALITLLSITVFLTADYIAHFFVKENVSNISFGIRFLSIVPIVVCINTPAYQTLLAYDFQKSYMLILIGGSLLNFILNIFLTKSFLMTGTIISVITTELFITVGLYTVLHIRHRGFSLLKLNGNKSF